ncbi:hypothetical protein H2P46_21765 [Mixta sp. Marseille-Q2057]|nr:hypothetical protein [Mixta mediterraneensis]
MTDIVFKRRKENSKSRRMRERGEHYAATKAQCDADRSTARKIEAAFSKLSVGCSLNVSRATSSPSLREKHESTSACLSEIAIYNAGYRTVRKGAVHITK